MITIDEAIETLAESAYGGSTTHNQRFKDSCKLGFEALQAVKKKQMEFPTLAHLWLPSQAREPETPAPGEN